MAKKKVMKKVSRTKRVTKKAPAKKPVTIDSCCCSGSFMENYGLGLVAIVAIIGIVLLILLL